MSVLNSTKPPPQQMPEKGQDAESLMRNCILGSHILHYHGVLDAYGHLSFRHPTKTDVFVMPRNMAPANIASPADLVEYYVSDASAVSSNAPLGYIERYIHSEMYKKYAFVNSVIHSHASAVLPYSISGVPLRPCLHMAGFLGASTPVFDITKHYGQSDVRDLLVRSASQGEALASCFVMSNGGSARDQSSPHHSVVLMRGHGYTVAAPSIEQCVFRAVYTKENATVQTTSISLKAAYEASGGRGGQAVQYLHEDEIVPTTEMSRTAWSRAWGLWTREVETMRLYANALQ